MSLSCGALWNAHLERVTLAQAYAHVDPQALREKVQGQKAADPQVAKLAEALAVLPAEARAALLDALQVGGE